MVCLFLILVDTGYIWLYFVILVINGDKWSSAVNDSQCLDGFTILWHPYFRLISCPEWNDTWLTHIRITRFKSLLCKLHGRCLKMGYTIGPWYTPKWLFQDPTCRTSQFKGFSKTFRHIHVTCGNLTWLCFVFPYLWTIFFWFPIKEWGTFRRVRLREMIPGIRSQSGNWT